MQKLQYTDEDGNHYSYTHDRTTSEEVSAQRNLVFTIKGAYSHSEPATHSGGTGGTVITLYATEQRFGQKSHHLTPAVSLLLTHIEFEYIPSGMGVLFGRVVEGQIEALGIDPQPYLKAMAREGVPWASVADLIVCCAAVEEMKWTVRAEAPVVGTPYREDLCADGVPG